MVIFYDITTRNVRQDTSPDNPIGKLVQFNVHVFTIYMFIHYTISTAYVNLFMGAQADFVSKLHSNDHPCPLQPHHLPIPVNRKTSTTFITSKIKINTCQKTSCMKFSMFGETMKYPSFHWEKCIKVSVINFCITQWYEDMKLPC